MAAREHYARVGVVRFRLSDTVSTQLEDAIRRHGDSALAMRLGVQVSTIDRLRFGGTATEEAVDKVTEGLARLARGPVGVRKTGGLR